MFLPQVSIVVSFGERGFLLAVIIPETLVSALRKDTDECFSEEQDVESTPPPHTHTGNTAEEGAERNLRNGGAAGMHILSSGVTDIRVCRRWSPSTSWQGVGRPSSDPPFRDNLYALMADGREHFSGIATGKV